MAEKLLIQVWVEADMAERVARIRKTHKIANADLLREGLAEILTRLEAGPAPFPDAADEAP